MKVIKPEYRIAAFTEDLLDTIEYAARTCYLSEPKVEVPGFPLDYQHEAALEKRARERAEFIRDKIKKGHESILEHGAITVVITCDRGVSHELVRHRIASFSQESTRYCNYSKDKFDNELTFIKPPFWNEGSAEYGIWELSMRTAEQRYLSLIAIGAKPEQARSVLPNSLKTKIVVTANPREWRHIFKLRCSPAAHPQMREIMIPMLEDFKEMWPPLYDDIEV